MIEVIYKEEKQEAKNGENLFNLPRNIRQVGLTTGNMRIYIEDYVYTFLTRLARNAVGSGKFRLHSCLEQGLLLALGCWLLPELCLALEFQLEQVFRLVPESQPVLR